MMCEEERKRFAHLTAEQKRRDNLKQSFSSLKTLVPFFFIIFYLFLINIDGVFNILFLFLKKKW